MVRNIHKASFLGLKGDECGDADKGLLEIVIDACACAGNIGGHAGSFCHLHGYDCYYQTKISLTKQDRNAIARAFAVLAMIPEGEREAEPCGGDFEQRATVACC